MDQEINFDDLSSDKFVKLSKSLSINQIANIFEKLNIINNYYRIDLLKFKEVFSKCNKETQDKLVLNIDVEYLTELLKSNLISFQKMYENVNIFNNINDFMSKMDTKDMLKSVIDNINDVLFKKI